jgi:hypothetical protein
MNLGEILTQSRSELDDTQPDYLWSDSELIGYANEAQEQACRRSRLIIDSSTVEICEIPVVAGVSLYPLDERILAIKDVVDANGRVLVGATVGWMNENVSGWRSSEGEPSAIITDFETDKLKLYPTPKVDSVIRLRVVRTQLSDMVSEQDRPEIKSRYHRALIHWIKHRAYLKKDADTLDKNASADSLSLFELEFGKTRPAYNIEFDLNNLPYDSLDGSF